MRLILLFGGVLVAGLAVIFLPMLSSSDNAENLASGAPLVHVTLPSSLSEIAAQGKLAFEAQCASCHGISAAGNDGAGPPLIHKIYEPSHHGDAAFFLAPVRGVRAHHWPFGDMPPVEGITEDEIKNIVVYIRELQRANGLSKETYD